MKMMKFHQAIFSAWISRTSVKLFSSQKYNRNMFYLLKYTSVDFFRLFGLWEESHWLYTSFLKKIIYNLSICCFLEDFHLVLLLATIWRSNLWVLRKFDYLNDYRLSSLFSNHKSKSWKPWHIFILYIF